MQELERTNDFVRLSWLQALLAAAGIKAVILDSHMSAVEGSIGAIPRRVMVRDEDEERARAMLRAAGEAG
jgi:Putative prokaryotic signal transducing protein